MPIDYINYDLDKVYDSQDFPLGAKVYEGDREFVFVKYNQGDGAVAGAAGKFLCGLDHNYQDFEATCDFDSATIKAITNDAKGQLQAALTNGKFGWAQTRGRNRKAATTDGSVGANWNLMLDSASEGNIKGNGNTDTVIGTALADDDGTTLAAGRIALKIVV